MSTDSVLNVVLTANKAGYSRTLRAARSEASAFGSAFSSTMGKLGVGLTIAGTAYLVKSQMDAIDSTADLSQRLNVQVGDLQKLRYACKLSGGSVQLLDDKLSFMTKSLGKAAAAGSGDTFDALKDMGLDPKALASMAPDDAFREIAEGISKLENPFQRAAAAQAIFGKGSDKLLNTLMLGKDGLNQMGSAAEKIGYSYSAADAAKIQTANDALDELAATWEGIKNTIVIALAPAIGDLAKGIQSLSCKHLVGEFGAVTVAAKGLAAVLSGIGKLLELGTLQMEQQTIWVERSQVAWQELKGGLGGDSEDTAEWTRLLDRRQATLNRRVAELVGLAPPAPDRMPPPPPFAGPVPFEAPASAQKPHELTPTVIRNTQEDYKLDAMRYRQLNPAARDHRAKDPGKEQVGQLKAANRLLDRVVRAVEQKPQVYDVSRTA